MKSPARGSGKGCCEVKVFTEDRSVMLGKYIAHNRATVREAAKEFGISKSTVHKDVSVRLRAQNSEIYRQVKEILEFNKQERHIRGGMATKEKYRHLAE